MSRPQYSMVFLGLSITSSWGNGHATTYRALLSELAQRGHRIRFLERDLPFYRANRDLPDPPFATTETYDSLDELRDRFSGAIRDADLVVVGSYVPEGRRVLDFVLGTARGKTAFYDIDTPVTLAALASNTSEYIECKQIRALDLIYRLPAGRLCRRWKGTMARRGPAIALFRRPRPLLSDPAPAKWDCGYLGTFSEDRQPKVDDLLLEPARQAPGMRFVVAGPQYPPTIPWPANVERIEHLPPTQHRAFYNAQRFTLNVTRRDMVRAGYSPSVRLFEAALCATPIISDLWPGIETFLEPGREVLLARNAAEASAYLTTLSEDRLRQVGESARKRVLSDHTARHRAEALEGHSMNCS